MSTFISRERLGGAVPGFPAVEGNPMPATYEPGQSYYYPLLIKHILEMPLVFAPNQEIVEAIPKMSVGKINKVALRKTYGA